MIKGRIFAANPFQGHGRVLFFFIPVMCQDGFKLWILAGIYPLVISVNGFQLFHQQSN
jgi:hypothetical protein